MQSSRDERRPRPALVAWLVTAARSMTAAPPPAAGTMPNAAATRWRVHPAWWLALALAALSLAAAILSVGYAVSSGDYGTLISHQFLIPFITAAYAFLGALVLSRLPRHPIGRIFLAVGVLSALNGLGVTGNQYGPQLAAAGAASAAALLRWLGSWAWLPEIALSLGGILLLFPDGRLPSRRWQVIAWPGAAGLVAVTLGVAFHPGPLASWDLPANPYGIPAAAPLLALMLNVGSGPAFGAIAISLAAPIIRYRRARGLARLQMKWMVYAVALTVLTGILGVFLAAVWPAGDWGQDLSISLTSLSALGIAWAAAVVILRYRVYDIDLIINRTLVYGALTGLVVAIYALLVGALGTFVQARNNLLIGLVATGIAAVLFQPLRDRLQRGVNRLVYGERDDPYAVLAGLGRRLESVPAANETLATIAQTVAQMLKLPYAGLTLIQGEDEVVAADYGRTTVEPVRFPLVHQGETIGHLLAGPRAPGERLNPAESRLLEDVAHQAAIAAHAVRLTADLQQSRERLVTAREEERRRLRRDLHDGLGPALAGLMLKAEAAKDATATDPAAAETLLNELKTDIQGTLSDVRRLVYNLRPPALDEFGLVGAIRDYLLQGNWPNTLCVELEAPESLPTLPAAVEVAAYRVVQEAVTNVVRHARAQRCTVRLAPQGNVLQVEVQDDGRGLPVGWRAGVGIAAMRERAAELGGSFTIGPAAGRGTGLVARLPLARSQ